VLHRARFRQAEVQGSLGVEALNNAREYNSRSRKYYYQIAVNM